MPFRFRGPQAAIAAARGWLIGPRFQGLEIETQSRAGVDSTSRSLPICT